MLANLLLFAQQEMPNFSGEVPEAAILGGLLFVIGVVALVSLAIGIVILYLIFSCYQRIPERHRQMEPWQVWLTLIPIFGIVWIFFVFPKLGKSYQSYFAEQGRTDVGDCGEKVGLWYAICVVASKAELLIVCIVARSVQEIHGAWVVDVQETHRATHMLCLFVADLAVVVCRRAAGVNRSALKIASSTDDLAA